MSNAHNAALNVLCRFSAEMAYVQKRLCIRNTSFEVRQHLQRAALEIEEAIEQQEKDERNAARTPD